MRSLTRRLAPLRCGSLHRWRRHLSAEMSAPWDPIPELLHSLGSGMGCSRLSDFSGKPRHPPWGSAEVVGQPVSQATPWELQPPSGSRNPSANNPLLRTIHIDFQGTFHSPPADLSAFIPERSSDSENRIVRMRRAPIRILLITNFNSGVTSQQTVVQPGLRHPAEALSASLPGLHDTSASTSNVRPSDSRQASHSQTAHYRRSS